MRDVIGILILFALVFAMWAVMIWAATPALRREGLHYDALESARLAH